MQNITTDTHDIRAAYTLNDSHEWHEIDVNGYNFAEIGADMLDFWNDADHRAEQFTVARTFNPDGYTTVTEIVGKLYGFLDGVLTANVVDSVTVHVTATER